MLRGILRRHGMWVYTQKRVRRGRRKYPFKMKKGDLLEGAVTRVDFPGKGIVETPDGDCIVKNVLPGQIVRVRVTKKRRGRMEGTLQEVLEKAPAECPSPCPHFGACGGCLYLNLPFEEELKLKRQQVERLLESAMEQGRRLAGDPDPEGSSADGSTESGRPSAAGALDPGRPSADESSRDPLSLSCWFEGILPSPKAFRYRNKMEFTFGDEYKDGPLALGLHKRGGFYDIVTVDGCRLTDPDFSLILRTVLSWFQEREADGEKFPFYHRLRHTGYLRHLLVRRAAFTGEILIDLVTTSQLEPDLSGLVQALLALQKEELRAPAAVQKESSSGMLRGRIAGILHTTNDSLADVVADQGTEILYGKDFFTEKLLGLEFRVTPFSFFQTNSYGAEVLYDTARRFLTEGGLQQGVLYDLYCGTGTIAQLMAPYADRVIGVEIVEEAVEAARRNAVRNGLSNCEFIAGDVLKVLDAIPVKPDTIILDPPRDGIHPKALPRILSYGVRNILYISCKPTSLARDLPAFLAAGYRPVRGVCVDQFPWTSSVETICLLSRL